MPEFEAALVLSKCLHLFFTIPWYLARSWDLKDQLLAQNSGLMTAPGSLPAQAPQTVGTIILGLLGLQ